MSSWSWCTAVQNVLDLPGRSLQWQQLQAWRSSPPQSSWAPRPTRWTRWRTGWRLSSQSWFRKVMMMLVRMVIMMIVKTYYLHRTTRLGRTLFDLLEHWLADVHHPQLPHFLKSFCGQHLFQEVDVLLVNVDCHPSPQAWQLTNQSPPCGSDYESKNNFNVKIDNKLTHFCDFSIEQKKIRIQSHHLQTSTADLRSFGWRCLNTFSSISAGRLLLIWASSAPKTSLCISLGSLVLVEPSWVSRVLCQISALPPFPVVDSPLPEFHQLISDETIPWEAFSQVGKYSQVGKFSLLDALVLLAIFSSFSWLLLIDWALTQHWIAITSVMSSMVVIGAT